MLNLAETTIQGCFRFFVTLKGTTMFGIKMNFG